MTTLTRDEVMTKFARDDRFAVSLLIEMYHRQTEDEQLSGSTNHRNGQGFNGTDADFLSSLAAQAIERRAQRQAGDIPSHWTDLSPRQMEVLRKKMAKYAGQLTDITNAQIAVRMEAGDWTLRGPVSLPGTVVVGNDDHVHLTAAYLDYQGDRPEMEETPWGTRPTATQIAPLPDHLTHKRVRVKEEVAVAAEPFLSAASALVACPGGFRFKSDKERWENGGKQEFNAGIDRWFRDRDGNTVGGRPAVAVPGDPFA